MTSIDITPADVEDPEFAEPDDVDACTLCRGTGYYTPQHSILRPRGDLTVTCPSCGGSGEHVDHGPSWCAS